MFQLISNSPLSDVLAPPVSSLEEFIFQWNTFSEFFQNHHTSNNKNKNTRCNIETTNLPNKLIKMCDILVTEQLDWIKKKKDPFCLSPSMEYLLQSNILETLSFAAQTDTPIGICPHVLLFTTRILNDSKVNLIPHTSAHTALNKLIVVCGKIQASPYEATEMYFLTSLVNVIHKNPEYLSFFSHDSFSLINSLLLLLYSEDSEISKLAGESIIRLMQILNNENDAKTIVTKTPFCCKLVNQIITHYNAIPHTLKIEDIEMVNCSFHCQNGDNDAPLPTFSLSVRKFPCFLKWYIFFDMVINNLPEESILTVNLLSEFKTNFLEGCLLPDLTGEGFENEQDAIDSVSLATVLISNCLRNTENSTLFDMICHFLILPDNQTQDYLLPATTKSTLPQTLLKRCQIAEIFEQTSNVVVNEKSNDEHGEMRNKLIKLSSVTLQLFEDILSRPSFEIVNNLILNHLSSRNYLDPGFKYQDAGPLDKQIYLTHVSSKFDSIAVLDQMNSVANEIHNLSNMSLTSHLDVEHLIKILHLFLSLIPDELKFDVQNERSEYEAYLKEAVKGFHMFVVNCFHKWRISSQNSTEQTTNPSDQSKNFIEIIFDNLMALFRLPYEINIQMFSIFAKISLIPNDLINEYFLDATIGLRDDHRTLFTILHRLIEQLQILVKGIDHLHVRLKQTKMRLLGELTIINEDDQENDVQQDDYQMNKILESLVILEEFIKELSSIIYAKNYILKLCNDKINNQKN